MTDGRVGVINSIFDAGSPVHLHVGDGEDALAVGAGDFALVPVLVHPANEYDALPLQGNPGTALLE